MLWEAVTEWAATVSGAACPPVYRTNPIGVVIMKTRARIRQWYRKQRARYHIERALNVEINERGLPQYRRYWERELAAAVTPGEKRRAQTVLRILARVGDQAHVRAKLETQAFLKAVRWYTREELSRLALAALNARAIDAATYGLLSHDGPYHALPPTLLRERTGRELARLRQQKRRARARLSVWRNSPAGRQAVRDIHCRLADHPAGRALSRAEAQLSIEL